MRELRLTRTPIDLSTFRSRGAEASDVATLIRSPVRILDAATGDPLLIYLHLHHSPDDAPLLDAIEQAIVTIKYGVSTRTSGLPTTSRIFGYRPRTTIRNDWCSVASLAREFPVEHDTIAAGAAIASRHYAAEAPDLFAHHQELAERALPDWRIEGGAFTSGIVNQNNPLKYHFDGGNFSGVWSGMLAFKRHVSGGYLAIPELDLALEIRDRSLLLFDGQSLLHGVTPFRLLRPTSRRHTIVYYSLKAMWSCLPLGEEVARIRRLRTDRERRLAALTP